MSETVKPTAKSLFQQLEGNIGEASSELLVEVQTEIAKDRAEKVKNLMRVGASVYERQNEELSRFRQRVGQVEKKFKDSLTAMVDLTQRVMDGDQEAIDNYENEMVKIRSSACDNARFIIADMPLMAQAAQTGSGQVCQSTQSLGGLLRNNLCHTIGCPERRRVKGAIGTCDKSACRSRERLILRPSSKY